MGFGWSDTLPYVAITTLSVPISGPGLITNCPIDMSYNFWDMNGEGHELYLSAVGHQQTPPGSPGSGSDCSNIPGGNYGASRTGGDSQVYAQLEANCAGFSSGQSELSDCQSPSPALTVTDLRGTTYSFRGGSFSGGGGSAFIQMLRPDLIEDRNGNTVRFSTYPGNFGFPVTDTLGRTLISRTLNPNPTNSAYPTANSVTVGGLTYTLGYTTVSANFTLGSHNLPISSAYLESCSFSGNATVSQRQALSSITYPNGQKYTFTYDPVYGLMSNIHYPNGAWVHYDWMVSTDYTTLASFDGQAQGGGPFSGGCNYQYQTVVVKTRTVYPSASRSTPSQVQTFSSPRTVWDTTAQDAPKWTSKTDTVQTLDNVLGKTSQTVYTYGYVLKAAQNSAHQMPSQLAVENVVTEYDWNNTTTPLRTTTKTWLDEYYIGSESTTWNNNPALTTKSIYCYTGSPCAPSNANGYLYSRTDYDFTSQTTPARTTTYLYYVFTSPCLMIAPAAQDPCAFWTPTGIGFEPTQIRTTDGTGARVSEMDATYDGTGVQDVPNLVAGTHDDGAPGFRYAGSSAQKRGNLTKLVKWSNNGASPTTTYTYDSTGQRISMKQPCDNASCADWKAGNTQGWTYSYVDSFDTANGSGGQPPSGQVTNAYMTKITDPLGHGSQFTYAYMDGQLTKSLDANSQSMSYAYADPLRRLTETDLPDGGRTILAYNDAAHTITSTKVASPDPSIVQTSVLDGMGQVVQTQLSDPSGTDIVDTSYDGEGRVATKSNPYRLGVPSATDGTTKITYDALGRTVLQTNQDGTTQQWCYNGVSSAGQANCSGSLSSRKLASWVDFTDESGHHWQRVSDGFGRLVAVMEPNPTSGTPSLETDYSYDSLYNLTNVTQHGTSAEAARSRGFVYDSVSRLVAGSNPETGSGLTCAGASGSTWSVCYSYDANGNLAAKTNARNITTSYAYDSLNRVLAKVNTDGTPSSCFQYDAANPAVANSVGRLVNEWTQKGACSASVPASGLLTHRSFLAYDVVGRPTQTQQCVLANCTSGSPFTLNETFDLAGNAISWTNGLGTNTFTQSFSSAGRQLGLSSSTGGTTSPTPLLSGAIYNPAGALQTWTLGTGLSLQRTYDTRLRVTSETATHP